MKPLSIVWLYPNDMSFYGDAGNVIALQRRLEWRGLPVKITYHHAGKKLDSSADLVVGGGGQDSGQQHIYKDLLRIGSGLRAMAERGVPMLMVCGLFQLFGNNFVTANGKEMAGIGIFNTETIATSKRLIGNITLRTEFGKIVGYENHSGQTYLLGGQQPFGSVQRGFGNTSLGDVEGAIYEHVYGTYLHGALLPKNPVFTDALLEMAYEARDGKSIKLSALDDTFATKARLAAERRPQ